MMLLLWMLGFICGHISRINALGPLDCSGVDPHDNEEVIQSINMMVTCGSDSIVARINTCLLEEMGFDLAEDISFAGIDDHPREEGKICSLETEEEGDYFYMTLRNFSDCRTQAFPSGNKMSYYNAVRSVGFSNTNNQTVRRTRSIYMPFGCRYQTMFNATLGGYEVVDADVIIIPGGDEVVPVDISLDLCCDYHCINGSIQPNDTVGPGDLLYLVAESSTIQLIEINYFYATRVPEPVDDSDRYYLVEDGCPQHFTTTVLSMQPYHVFVKFFMFNWPLDEDTDVYFHADAQLCNPITSDCYPPQCDEPLRYKRQAGSQSNSRRSVTLGPFHFKTSNVKSDTSADSGMGGR